MRHVTAAGRCMVFSLLCAFFAASIIAHAQFKEIGPAPVSQAVARQQIRTLLEKVDQDNTQPTIRTLSGLTPWYRDLLDEELIAAWRREDKANLPGVIEPLADPRVATGIVEFSWRQQRQATFIPAYAPMLGHLMARYADSGSMFLGDLLGSTAIGQAPDLSQPEVEAVCRILLDMPDIRTWRKSALQILPHYRRAAQILLDRDLSESDRGKRDRAAQWLKDLAAVGSAFETRLSASAATPRLAPAPSHVTAPDSSNLPDGPIPSNHNANAACPSCSKYGDPLSGIGPTYNGPGSSGSAGGTAHDGSYQVGNGVSAPTLTFKVQPEYSETARKLVAQGTVLLTIVVQPDGTARDFKVLRSLGYGLDEKAIEAVRKWRFNPGMKDGHAVPVAAQVEENFRLLELGGDRWTSGPMIFALESGLAPPVVKGGTMLNKPVDGISNESAVFDFTVDPRGTVENIHAIHGSASAIELLTTYLATWRFQPAVRGNRSVEATGRVRFVRGQGDEAAKLPLSPPLLQSNPPEPVRASDVQGSTWAPTRPQSITSVIFRGSPENPTVLIYGQGFNPQPAATNIAYAGSTGNDYGTELHLTDSTGPTAFHAGYNDVSEHDSIGLVISTYSDIFISYTLGSVYGSYYYPNRIFRLNEGDRFTVYVRNASFSGIVHYGVEREDRTPPVEKGQTRTMVNPTDGQRYVWIPPGSFTMGCSPGDSECKADEKPSHAERIAEGFWLGQTEVTQAAYQRVTGGNPSQNKGDQLPVESLIWNHAANYCRAIGGRLPTEVEWEYAARAGIAWARYGSLDEVAWHTGNSGKAIHPVAMKEPNAFGLLDMLGNVWEYVADSYSGGSDKILRGGAWTFDPVFARASSRLRSGPSDSGWGRGFRCAGNWPASGAAEKSTPSATPVSAAPVRTVNPSVEGPHVSMVDMRDGQTYVWIPPGAFTMGCSQGDAECNGNEEPPHAEVIASGFWLGQTEVAQAAYQRVTKTNPSHNKGDQLPVENVTWNEATQYCGTIGGRLPTETEWEYAARGHAGITGARYGNPDAVAWHFGNSGGTTHPVAQKQPNAFGLYDILGNVWEWVEDSPAGDSILRGGSAGADPENVRASRRSVVAPSEATPYRGFRCTGEWPALEKAPLGGTPSIAVPTAGSGGGPRDGVNRVGNGVSPPQLVYKVEPEYSEAARKARIDGSVLLSIKVDPTGKVIKVGVLHGLGLGLDEKAMEAVRRWKFRPSIKDGQPVEFDGQVEVQFRLQ